MGNIAIRSSAIGVLKPEARHEPTFIAAASASDIPKIVDMVNREAERSGAVLRVSSSDVSEWVSGRRSFVAKTIHEEEIVGHTAAKIWPESGWAEHRAVVVVPEFRGNGINAKLTEAIVQHLAGTSPGITILSLKNEKSGGRGTVESFGFKHVPISCVPNDILNAKEKKKYDAYVFHTLARQQ